MLPYTLYYLVWLYYLIYITLHGFNETILIALILKNLSGK